MNARAHGTLAETPPDPTIPAPEETNPEPTMAMFRAEDRVLFIGAHPDDIEIGAGGTVYRLTSAGASVHFLILTHGTHRLSPGLRELSERISERAADPQMPSPSTYDVRSRHGESIAAAACLGVPETNVFVATAFEDTRLQMHAHALIRFIEDFCFDEHGRDRFDVVATHAGGDRHSDHNQVHESSLAALRFFRGRILAYRSPSTKINMFAPNHFEILGEPAMEAKLEALRCHASQRDKMFMQEAHIRRMASEWTSFLNLPDALIEQFQVIQSISGGV